jgi:hypothetical protein
MGMYPRQEHWAMRVKHIKVVELSTVTEQRSMQYQHAVASTPKQLCLQHRIPFTTAYII